jgi:hypothetical protein
MTDVMDGVDRSTPELMALQVEILTRIHEAQVRQRDLLEAIRAQQEALVEAARTPVAQTLPAVKVIDLNMPFPALAGTLVKVALAAIPAALALGAIGLAVTLAAIVVRQALGG